jgi:hypothetical protein
VNHASGPCRGRYHTDRQPGAAWTEGARGHCVTRDDHGAAGSMGQRRGWRRGQTVPQRRPVTPISYESPRPVTAPRSARGTPRPVPHRAAECGDRARLRASDRGKGERRCRRRGWPFKGWGWIVRRRRRWHKDAARAALRRPRSHVPAPRSGAGLSPAPKAMGRDQRPAVWLHSHGMAPRSVAAIVGQRGALASPARDCGRVPALYLGFTWVKIAGRAAAPPPTVPGAGPRCGGSSPQVRVRARGSQP